jgi:hypothetical protein
MSIECSESSGRLILWLRQFNKWDKQFTELTHGSQKLAVGKLYMGVHSNSPEFKFWLKRARLWRRLRAHKVTPVPDPRNLYRAMRGDGCEDPGQLSLQEVEVKLAVIEAELEKAKQRSPEMREEHLARRLNAAKERDICGPKITGKFPV